MAACRSPTRRAASPRGASTCKRTTASSSASTFPTALDAQDARGRALPHPQRHPDAVGQAYNLLRSCPNWLAAGVDILRISPQRHGTTEVLAAFRQAVIGELSPRAAWRTVQRTDAGRRLQRLLAWPAGSRTNRGSRMMKILQAARPPARLHSAGAPDPPGDRPAATAADAGAGDRPQPGARPHDPARTAGTADRQALHHPHPRRRHDAALRLRQSRLPADLRCRAGRPHYFRQEPRFPRPAGARRRSRHPVLQPPPADGRRHRPRPAGQEHPRRHRAAALRSGPAGTGRIAAPPARPPGLARGPPEPFRRSGAFAACRSISPAPIRCWRSTAASTPSDGWRDSGVAAQRFPDRRLAALPHAFDLARNLAAYLPLGFLWVAGLRPRLATPSAVVRRRAHRWPASVWCSSRSRISCPAGCHRTSTWPAMSRERWSAPWPAPAGAAPCSMAAGCMPCATSCFGPVPWPMRACCCSGSGC